MTDRTQSSGTPLLLLLGIGALVGAAAAGYAFRGRGSANARVNSHELTTLLPSGSRATLIADVTRMRNVAALRALFVPLPSNAPCEAQLLRRIDHMVAALGVSGFGDLAVAFTGDLPHDELLTCARTRAASNHNEVATDHVLGFDRVRIARPARPELLPPASVSEIAYLPGGVVIAGGGEVAERMIDVAMSDRRLVDEATPASELRRRLGTGHDVVITWIPSVTDLPVEADAAFRHVAGVGFSATFGTGADLVMVVACDDFDSPRAVADAITHARDSSVAQVSVPAIATLLRAIEIERRATEVRIRVSVSSDQLEALMTLLPSLLVQSEPVQP